MRGVVIGLLLFVASAAGVRAQTISCPTRRTVIDIPASGNAATRQCLKNLLISSVQSPNTIVRMGPTVYFDFTDVKSLPIEVGRCTTLTSVAYFPYPVHNACLPVVVEGRRAGKTVKARAVTPAIGVFPPSPPSGRSTHSAGPILFYGKHPDLSSSTAFFESRCTGGFSNDGVRVSGFRLYGPTFGDQTTDEVGFRVEACLDVEVSNMEVAGWGGAGVEVLNSAFTDIPTMKPAPVTTLIHDSWLHDNHHPQANGHAEGYGVETGQGGWSRIYNNLFDNNRHDIAASGKAGGYDAVDNLLLKGGGYHGEWYEHWTQVVDAHGTDSCGIGSWFSSSLYNCGDAGRDFLIQHNVIQYTRNEDVHIRGKPRDLATIDGNFFGRSSEGDAITLETNDHVTVTKTNKYNVDGFGQYAVCDLDGDGYDDLFFPTGLTWWVSGQGTYPWTFLVANELPMEDLRFGYFDGSNTCDVAAELPSGSGQFFISKAGRTDIFATPLANLAHPASEIVFGRFDPVAVDTRPGATLQTTHAFWRRSDGQWFVTPLTNVNWQAVQSSGFPLSKLRFGSFTGNGNTDVLAVEGGHWSISEGARKPWRTLNPTLSDPVENLYIANMDADDNIDDILKLDLKYTIAYQGSIPYIVATLTWYRSKNGVEPWKVWSSYTFAYAAEDAGYVTPGTAFVGRFGRAPGQGATLIIDQNRAGEFASQNGTIRWTNGLFKY